MPDFYLHFDFEWPAHFTLVRATASMVENSLPDCKHKHSATEFYGPFSRQSYLSVDEK